MKLFILIGLVVTLAAVNSHAGDPCEKVAAKAARKWAKAQPWANYQPIKSYSFKVSSYSINEKGESVALVYLYRDGGMCWTNIDVTVQESSDDDCKATHVQENAIPDGCV